MKKMRIFFIKQLYKICMNSDDMNVITMVKIYLEMTMTAKKFSVSQTKDLSITIQHYMYISRVICY